MSAAKKHCHNRVTWIARWFPKPRHANLLFQTHADSFEMGHICIATWREKMAAGAARQPTPSAPCQKLKSSNCLDKFHLKLDRPLPLFQGRLPIGRRKRVSIARMSFDSIGKDRRKLLSASSNIPRHCRDSNVYSFSFAL